MEATETNQEQDLSQKFKKLEFLWILGHNYAQINPALSRFYLKKMAEWAQQNEIPLAPSIENKFCPSCYNLLVPGQNCSVRIESVKKLTKIRRNALKSQTSIESFSTSTQKETDLLKNAVIILCKVCKFSNDLPASRRGFLQKLKENPKQTIVSPKIEHKKKQKSKGSKLSTLKNLIKEKEKQASKRKNTLDIHSFLQSLN